MIAPQDERGWFVFRQRGGLGAVGRWLSVAVAVMMWAWWSPIQRKTSCCTCGRRDALLGKLDGLSSYDARRPMTPTATNLLGLVKHVACVQAGYFGVTFDRPFPDQLPWEAEGAAPDDDIEGERGWPQMGSTVTASAPRVPPLGPSLHTEVTRGPKSVRTATP